MWNISMPGSRSLFIKVIEQRRKYTEISSKILFLILKLDMGDSFFLMNSNSPIKFPTTALQFSRLIAHYHSNLLHVPIKI